MKTLRTLRSIMEDGTTLIRVQQHSLQFSVLGSVIFAASDIVVPESAAC